MKPTQLILLGVGAYLLYQIAQRAQLTGLVQHSMMPPGGPQYGGTSMAGTSGTGVTNPLTALASGVSNLFSRIFAHPTNGPGNTPAVPSSSSSSTPLISGPPPNPMALPATPDAYFLPVSPELYLPNLGDPNLWWQGDAIALYQSMPQDISGANQNVSSDVPIAWPF